jgi:hypothetical protein
MSSLTERFPGIQSPTNNFGDVITDLRTTPLMIDIDLTTARSFAANTAAKIDIAGNLLYVDQKANSGYATLHIQDDAPAGNTGITIFPGFIARVPFTRLYIENDAQPGVTMRLIYGVDLDFVPAVSPGSGIVSVISGEKSRVLAGVAYSVGTFIAATAAQYSHLFLFNPVGSGKRLIVDALYGYLPTGVSGEILVRTGNTLVGTTVTPTSHYLGSAIASVASLIYAPDVVLRGAPHLFTLQCVTGAVVEKRFIEPLIVPPGFGLFMMPGVVNQAFTGYFHFYEESV